MVGRAGVGGVSLAHTDTGGRAHSMTISWSRTIRFLLVGLLATLGACSKPQEKQSAEQPASPSEPAPAPGSKPSGGMVMQSVIVIVNSGSANLIGYRILIGANGDTSFVSGDGPGHATLPAELYARLQADIAAAGPLSQLPSATDCLTPGTVATTTTIAMGGETSPDLGCTMGDAAQKLKADADAVVAFLKLRSVPRGLGKELPPQNL